MSYAPGVCGDGPIAPGMRPLPAITNATSPEAQATDGQVFAACSICLSCCLSPGGERAASNAVHLHYQRRRNRVRNRVDEQGRISRIFGTGLESQRKPGHSCPTRAVRRPFRVGIEGRATVGPSGPRLPRARSLLGTRIGQGDDRPSAPMWAPGAIRESAYSLHDVGRATA
jgi:hypothetical protein